jgi:hypothetical protein
MPAAECAAAPLLHQAHHKLGKNVSRVQLRLLPGQLFTLEAMKGAFFHAMPAGVHAENLVWDFLTKR